MIVALAAVMHTQETLELSLKIAQPQNHSQRPAPEDRDPIVART
jgi:biopolymer transport protein ExbD